MDPKTSQTSERERRTAAWRLLARAALAAGMTADQIARFWRARYLPQPRQMDFHAACRLADYGYGPTHIGFGGARGPGKSHAMVAQIALDDCQRQPGLKCLLLRRVGKSVREGLEDLRTRVLRHTPHDWRRGEGMLVFPNGSRVVLGHFQDESDVDAYLGLEYDVIGVEEATTLTWSKYRAILTCNRTSKRDWRPRVYSTTNPGGVGHAWYKKLMVSAEPGGSTCFIPATVDDNHFINAEYRAVLDSLTGWQKRAWRYGDWDIAAGQFFSTWRADMHVIEARPIPRNWRVWLAMDYGFTHHNVILLLAQDGDGNVYVVDELAEQRWLTPRHARALDAMLARWGMGRERIETFVAGSDCFAARPTVEGTVANQWEAEGYELERADDDRISGAAEILRRLGDAEAGIAPSLYIYERCARLIECLPALQHDPHRPEDVLKVDVDDDGSGGDDAYDALRYGVMVAATGASGSSADAELIEALVNWRG